MISNNPGYSLLQTAYFVRKPTTYLVAASNYSNILREYTSLCDVLFITDSSNRRDWPLMPIYTVEMTCKKLTNGFIALVSRER